MPIEAVLDSSAIVALYTPEEHSGWIKETIRKYNKLHILDLTLYEVTNALWKKFYFLKELSETELKRTLKGVWKFLDNLCFLHYYKEVKEKSIEFSIKYALTIYDSSYLALAEKLNINFITIDTKLYEKLWGTPLHKMILCP